jgi:hypothetical protein
LTWPRAGRPSANSVQPGTRRGRRPSEELLGDYFK